LAFKLMFLAKHFGKGLTLDSVGALNAFRPDDMTFNDLTSE